MILLPEYIIIGTAFLILILDLFSQKGLSQRSIVLVSLLGLFLAILQTAHLFDPQSVLMVAGRLSFDPLSLVIKEILLGSTILLILVSSSAFQEVSVQKITHRPEFFITLLFTLSGMMFLISSRDLITLYVSLELATIPLFALTAWNKNTQGGEAGIKYLIMGALGSAFLLYGFGFLYGITGSTSLEVIHNSIAPSFPDVLPMVVLAAALIMAGVSFKLTLFPFHMWAPDAYQGAPTPLTAFLSVASKTTGLILALQLFIKIFSQYLSQWSLLIAIVATLTMSLGNLVAIRQTNLKRFMAFSSISQAGYIIMGFLSTKPEALSAMVFYILIYAFTNLAAFGVIIIHIHSRNDEKITSLKGLSQTNPILALTFLIALFGLAGIPPLAGFVGKFFLFNIAALSGYYWLVAIAAINSTVSLYYYLRLVRQMYIEAPDKNTVAIQVSPWASLGLVIGAAGSILVGLTPQIYQNILIVSTQWLK